MEDERHRMDGAFERKEQYMKTENVEGTTETTAAATEMTEKLEQAGKKAETQKAERRERVVKGIHLQPVLLSKLAAAGITPEEKSGFLKAQGVAKGKTVYVAKKGGRVDLSGFTIESAAVKQITETEAREKHLGKVRGQLDFDQADDVVLAAFDAAVAVLLVPDPVVEAPKPAEPASAEVAPVAPATESN